MPLSWEAAGALERSKCHKRTLQAALWEAARASGRAPSGRRYINATKRTLQAALWEAARASGRAPSGKL